MRKETAANYIPPNKRKEIKDYLSGVSIWLPQSPYSPTSTQKDALKPHKIDREALLKERAHWHDKQQTHLVQDMLK